MADLIICAYPLTLFVHVSWLPVCLPRELDNRFHVHSTTTTTTRFNCLASFFARKPPGLGACLGGAQSAHPPLLAPSCHGLRPVGTGPASGWKWRLIPRPQQQHTAATQPPQPQQESKRWPFECYWQWQWHWQWPWFWPCWQ
jgi:hypothetical protein